MITQQECADAWRRRWADPVIERPSCYNRLEFDWSGRNGCSAWFPGGNAHVTARMIDKGGKVFEWYRCNGCERR